MNIEIIRVSNISTQLIKILYSAIPSSISATGIDPNLSGELSIPIGGRIIIESTRIDLGQLESLHSKLLIAYTTYDYQLSSPTPPPPPTPPTITTDNATTFTVGTEGNFIVIATGSPTPSLIETGDLPSGVTFIDNNDGTATLDGTPDSGTDGTYAFVITASSGIDNNTTQDFTLTVNPAEQIGPVTAIEQDWEVVIGTPRPNPNCSPSISCAFGPGNSNPSSHFAINSSGYPIPVFGGLSLRALDSEAYTNEWHGHDDIDINGNHYSNNNSNQVNAALLNTSGEHITWTIRMLLWDSGGSRLTYSVHGTSTTYGTFDFSVYDDNNPPYDLSNYSIDYSINNSQANNWTNWHLNQSLASQVTSIAVVAQRTYRDVSGSPGSILVSTDTQRHEVTING